jgi:hypothetical protein
MKPTAMGMGRWYFNEVDDSKSANTNRVYVAVAWGYSASTIELANSYFANAKVASPLLRLCLSCFALKILS